ncbi:MAG: hypothetical protein A2Y17_03880 [Clostridiales bacterium GWF2_38_85]|nr:MAG: hypothetical protein A2Y17_03880 [Clostridiales bacterium GWF2_38_85]HBL83935.1 hypothetical protein [Clostridiales bacterium]
MLNRRGIVIYADEFDQYWNKLIQSTNLNVLGIHPVADNAVVGNTQNRDILTVYTDFLNKYKDSIIRLQTLGISVEIEMHALSALLPRSQFTAHPEWFRMDKNGRRTPDFNMCASNKDALEFVSDNATALAKLYTPGSNRYNFWIDDVAETRCFCNECRKRTATDSALTIYNAIQRGLKKHNSLSTQCYLAYHDTNELPKNVVPEDGIFLEFAPMQRDFHMSINSVSSDKNKKELHSLSELLQFFGKQNAQVLEYWMDNSMHSGWKRPPRKFKLNQEVMKADVEFYKNCGFGSITSFGCFLGEDYYKLYGKYPEIDEYSRILS